MYFGFIPAALSVSQIGVKLVFGYSFTTAEFLELPFDLRFNFPSFLLAPAVRRSGDAIHV